MPLHNSWPLSYSQEYLREMGYRSRLPQQIVKQVLELRVAPVSVSRSRNLPDARPSAVASLAAGEKKKVNQWLIQRCRFSDSTARRGTIS